MSKLQMVLFCAAALAGSAGVAALLFPHAAVSRDVVAAAGTPQPMERFDDVDLGPDYGTLSVTELLGYYLENPPQASASQAAPAPRQRFGGC